MPFKSAAQARKFAQMLKDGKISQSMFDEWSHGVDIKKLPEHVKGSKSGAKKKEGVRHPLAFSSK